MLVDCLFDYYIDKTFQFIKDYGVNVKGELKWLHRSPSLQVEVTKNQNP
jgi:hypothetical protein